MKALITGAGGFVGSHLIKALQKSGIDVFATDSSPKSNLINLDITDTEKVKKIISEINPEVIYHLAAISFVPAAEKDFALALKVNVEGTYNLAASAYALTTPPKFIYISTANLYGDVTPAELPLTEDSPVRCNNNYSLSKIFAEQVVAKVYQNKNFVIFRPFNHIGPGQSPDFVIPSFAQQLVQMKQKKIPAVLKVGNIKAKRDFLDVRDVVRAYTLAAKQGQGIINLASGTSLAIEEIIAKLSEIIGIHPKIEIDPNRTRPTDIAELRGNAIQAKKELNWTPEISMEQSLRDIVDELLNK